MTEIKVRRVPSASMVNGEFFDELQLTVQGHANFAPKGKDTVCAAVSVLVQAYAAYLAGLAQEYLYDFSVDGLDGPGTVAITATPTKQGWEKLCGAFECIATGFFLVARRYSQNVSIQIDCEGR